MSDDKTNVLKIIPEFQYDLISRIIPGLILFTAIVSFFNLFPSSDTLSKASGVLIFAGSVCVIGICWAIGICLSALGYFLYRYSFWITTWRFWQRWPFGFCITINWENAIKETDINLDDLGSEYRVRPQDHKNPNWYITLMTHMIDKLKIKDTHVARMLPKISGESAFGFNLCAVSIIWFVIVLLKCFHEKWSYFSKMQLLKDILKEPYIVPVWSFVFIIIMLFVMNYRSKRYIKRAIAYHLALRTESRSAADNPPSPQPSPKGRGD